MYLWNWSSILAIITFSAQKTAEIYSKLYAFVLCARICKNFECENVYNTKIVQNLVKSPAFFFFHFGKILIIGGSVFIAVI
jgi:hypothetical protein